MVKSVERKKAERVAKRAIMSLVRKGILQIVDGVVSRTPLGLQLQKEEALRAGKKLQ